MSVEGMSSLLMTSLPGRSDTLPVEHLDYTYIQQCGDLKYLEKILHLLRSGREGVYPHLLDFCEKRIESLDPKHHALRKDTCPATVASFTTDEWKHITDDLQAWQREITENEQQLKHSPTFNTDFLPPVHNRALQKPANTTVTTTTRKRSAVPRAYSDWDRFDVDKECAKVNEDANNFPGVITSTHRDITPHINTLGLTQREKDVLATREREKGNEAFRARDWHEAIVYYTRSLSILPTVAGFNNRAQAEIKLQLWTDALRDCDAVLHIETHNCKALLRRATVHTHLGKLQAAHNDITTVLQAEPHNVTAQKLLQELNMKINKELQHEGKKLLIMEVDEEEEGEKHYDEKTGVGQQAQRDMAGQTERKTEKRIENKTDGEMKRLTERLKDGVRQSVDAAVMRTEGNELYRIGQYGDAAEKYTQGIMALVQSGVHMEEGMFFLYCNRAACFLKMGKCSECVSDCCRALQLQPFSVKALLRRAMAYENLEQFRLAYVDYRTVQQIDNTHNVQQHVNSLTQLLMEQDGSDWRMKLPEVPSVPLSVRYDGAESLPTPQTTPPTHTVPTMKPLPNAETLPTVKTPPTKQCSFTTEIPLQSHIRRLINIVEVESDVSDEDDEADAGDDKDEDDGADAGDDKDEDNGSDAGNDKDEDDGADAVDDKDEDDGADAGDDKDEDDGTDAVDDKDEDDGADAGDDTDKDDGADAGDDKDGDDGADGDIKSSNPANAFEFGQALNAACCRGDLAACARLLRSVSPHTLPHYISTQLDTHTISFITHTLRTHMLPTEPGLVYRLLTNLRSADRFTVVLMLMNLDEKRQVTRLFESLCMVECDEFSKENVNNLADKFI